jgi:hypothetical protein
MEKLAGRMVNIRKKLKSSPVMRLGIHVQLPNSTLKSVLQLDTTFII